MSNDDDSNDNINFPWNDSEPPSNNPNRNYNQDEPEDNDYWVPEQAINNLVTERIVHDGETSEQTTRRIFRENSPLVAQSIVSMAIRSRSERQRLDAGKYILDRVLGRVGEERILAGESPLEMFANEVEKALKQETESRK